MGRKFEKFLLLMWKNWLLQYRRPLQTFVEIIAPVIFSILLVVIRSLVDPETNPPKIFTPFCPVPIFCDDNSGSESPNLNFNASALQNVTLVYSPSGNKALSRAMSILNLAFGQVIGYENQQRLEAHFLDENASFTFAAIQLDDSLGNSPDLPHDLEVSLR